MEAFKRIAAAATVALLSGWAVATCDSSSEQEDSCYFKLTTDAASRKLSMECQSDGPAGMWTI